MEGSRGYLAVLSGAAILGGAVTLGAIALERMPLVVTLLVVQGVGVVALLPFARRGRPGREHLRVFLPLVILGAVIGPAAWYFGLERTTATDAALLANVEALATAAFAYMFLRERIHRWGYVGVGGLLVGAVAVTTNFDFSGLSFVENLGGNLLIITAMTCWGADNNLVRILVDRLDILSIAFYKFLLGTLLLLPLLFVLPISGPVRAGDTAILLVLGVSSVAFVTILFYSAIKRIGALRTGALIATTPLFGVVIASIVFGDPPGAAQIGGGLLMVVSTLLLAYRPDTP